MAYTETFDEKIKRHLEEYKAANFPDSEHGLWRNDPENVLKYAFVKADGNNNLIHKYKGKFLEYEGDLKNKKKKITRHMYFNHMNSSQAMCINFFFPLLAECQLELITEFLEFRTERINYGTVSFEKISEVDSIGGHRPTNFDFFFETKSGKKFFFEIKYTEQDFGKAPKDKSDKSKFDADHIEKFDAVYSNHLDSIKQEYKNRHNFLSNYQLMRNLIHIGDNCYVVFIYPNGNKKIRTEVNKARTEIVADKYLSNLFSVHWQEMFDFVFRKVQHPDVKAQFEEFGRKYFI